MAARNNRLLTAALIPFVLTACGPRRLTLPSGPGVPASEATALYDAARARCDAVRTLQAELGMSGRAGEQRVRGRVLVGMVPGALRLEGVAPFGSPAFILVADGTNGTLLLPRDRRVVRNAPPEEILNALVGLRLGADDLRSLLSGCVRAAGDAAEGRSYGERWRAVDLASGGTIFLEQQDGVWRIVAGRYDGLEVEYSGFNGDRPAHVRVSGNGLNLSMALSQVDTNGELPRDELVALKIPEDVQPLSVEELRRAGPLGER